MLVLFVIRLKLTDKSASMKSERWPRWIVIRINIGGGTRGAMAPQIFGN